MPSFLITSRVSASLPYVWSKFDQNLLAKLAPPFPIARIIQFDGCQVNDKVCIELDFLLYKTSWYSVISSYKADENAYVFVDEGTRVPFGIKAWRHEHRIELIDNQTSAIVDNISFHTNYKLLDWLLFPLIWGMIAYRIPLYKKYLHQPA